MNRELLIALLALAPLAAAAPARTQTPGQRTDAAARDRWQITRADGTHLWDLHLIRLAGDTLLVEQGDSLVNVPLGGIDELRLVQRFEQRGPQGQRSSIAALAGADDTVVKLTLLTLEERRRLVEELVRESLARAASPR